MRLIFSLFTLSLAIDHANLGSPKFMNVYDKDGSVTDKKLINGVVK